MKKIQDNFSKQSDVYKKYRPIYPRELYDEILQLTKEQGSCWDCGTGNGQVALELSKHFKKVYATDISKNQISKADKGNNIIYSVERSEQTSFKTDQFDLITVAQAIHWFDLIGFNKEVYRVAKNKAILAIWGYGLLRIDASLDLLIDGFYKNIVGPYWNQERKHVDTAYKTIPLDFKEIKLKKKHQIKTSWTLNELEGYLNSWSSVQNYIAINHKNPVDDLISMVNGIWDDKSSKEIRFPIFTRIGRIEK